MKEYRDNYELEKICARCRYASKSRRNEVSCCRPGQTSEDIAVAVIDAFFDGECECFEEQPQDA